MMIAGGLIERGVGHAIATEDQVSAKLWPLERQEPALKLLRPRPEWTPSAANLLMLPGCRPRRGCGARLVERRRDARPADDDARLRCRGQR